MSVRHLRLPLTVAALCLLGASPALLVEMRRPADVPRRADALSGRCDALTVLSVQSGTAVIGPYSTNFEGAPRKISISVESGTSLSGPLTIENCDGTVTIHADFAGGPR